MDFVTQMVGLTAALVSFITAALTWKIATQSMRVEAPIANPSVRIEVQQPRTASSLAAQYENSYRFITIINYQRKLGMVQSTAAISTAFLFAGYFPLGLDPCIVSSSRGFALVCSLTAFGTYCAMRSYRDMKNRKAPKPEDIF